MDKKFCPYCMTKITDGGACPNCKLTDGTYTPKPFHIPPGSILRDRYLVGKVLGEGGFGITYIGCDIQLEMKVAIKEYYPSDRVHRDASQSLNVGTYVGELERSYEKGKQRFLDEARVMARLTKEPAIVRVQDFFEMNNTAYIVMEYIEGTTLNDLTKQKGGKVPPSELFPLVEPLFRALQIMHEKNLVHRDISPDNIMIEGGKVRLLDFGCAREAIDKNETLTIQLKHGYAPIEQYQQKGQGPWTDVYAFAATLYFCLTGTKPPQALDRIMTDNLLRPTKLGIVLSPQQEKALLRALTVVPNRRTQSMEEFHAELFSVAPEPVIETGSLTVNTVVSGTDVMPEIRIKVTLSGDNVDPDGIYGDVELHGGIAEVTVKGGASVSVSDVPAGADYKVESDTPADFTVSSMRPEGRIEKNVSLAATFEYAAIEKPVGSLTIANRFIGADIGEAQNVRFTVTLSGGDVDPNGTYGGIEFKDGIAEITVGNGMSIVVSSIPAGASYKVEGESLEDFKLTAVKNEGVIEKGLSKSVRFDYKKLRKRVVKAPKAPEPEEVGQTVSVEPEPELVTVGAESEHTVAIEADAEAPKTDGAETVGQTVAIEADEVPKTEPAADDKPADESEKGGEKPDKKSKKNKKTAPEKITETTAVTESEEPEKPAEETETDGKDKSDDGVSEKGIKTIVVTAILAVGALLILLTLVLFGILGSRNKSGDDVLSNTDALNGGQHGDSSESDIKTQNSGIPKNLIFSYDFTDGAPDNGWEDASVYGLDSNNDLGDIFISAIRIDGARIVIEADASVALDEDGYSWQYGLQCANGSSAFATSGFDYGWGQLPAQSVTVSGGRAKIVINARSLVKAYLAHGGSFTDYVSWINGACEGCDTYSISVYAPDLVEMPKSVTETVFSYTQTLSKSDDYGWSLSMLEPWWDEVHHDEFFNAIHLGAAWVVIGFTQKTGETYSEVDLGNVYFGVQSCPFIDGEWLDGQWDIDYIHGTLDIDRFIVSAPFVSERIDEHLAEGWPNFQLHVVLDGVPDDAQIEATISVVVPNSTFYKEYFEAYSFERQVKTAGDELLGGYVDFDTFLNALDYDHSIVKFELSNATSWFAVGGFSTADGSNDLLTWNGCGWSDEADTFVVSGAALKQKFDSGDWDRSREMNILPILPDVNNHDYSRVVNVKVTVYGTIPEHEAPEGYEVSYAEYDASGYTFPLADWAKGGSKEAHPQFFLKSGAVLNGDEYIKVSVIVPQELDTSDWNLAVDIIYQSVNGWPKVEDIIITSENGVFEIECRLADLLNGTSISDYHDLYLEVCVWGTEEGEYIKAYRVTLFEPIG